MCLKGSCAVVILVPNCCVNYFANNFIGSCSISKSIYNHMTRCQRSAIIKVFYLNNCFWTRNFQNLPSSWTAIWQSEIYNFSKFGKFDPIKDDQGTINTRNCAVGYTGLCNVVPLQSCDLIMDPLPNWDHRNTHLEILDLTYGSEIRTCLDCSNKHCTEDSGFLYVTLLFDNLFKFCRRFSFRVYNRV